ncbi:hypothetical protein RS85_00135 [Microbacterium sp. SA39]|nr:hypothetical protein RS85_00135 [Microbacterium sp. SA39]
MPQLFWIPAVIAALGTIALVVLNASVPLVGPHDGNDGRKSARAGARHPS